MFWFFHGPCLNPVTMSPRADLTSPPPPPAAAASNRLPLIPTRAQPTATHSGISTPYWSHTVSIIKHTGLLRSVGVLIQGLWVEGIAPVHQIVTVLLKLYLQQLQLSHAYLRSSVHYPMSCTLKS